MYEDHGISSIIVAGSSGAYFQVADHILQMDRYVPKEITAFAKEEAKAFPLVTLPEEMPETPSFCRIIQSNRSFTKNGRNKLKTLGKDTFQINKETVDLRYAEQLCDAEQTTALGYTLLYAQLHLIDGRKDLRQIVEELMQIIETKGLAAILDCGYVKSNLAEPRKQEVFAAFNRYRKL